MERDDSDQDAGLSPDRFDSRGLWTRPPGSWGDVSPEELLSQRELGKVLKCEIAALPDMHRTVVTLRDVEGVPSDEVCKMLKISESNQRVILHRARAQLRTTIEEHLKVKGFVFREGS